MSGRLSGKTALVTGASSGIGAATALALAREGTAVAVAARRRDRLEALASEINQEGGQALALEADVTVEAQAQRVVTETAERLGRLDILVNNAGVMLLGPLEAADTEEWRRMMDVNLLALMYTTHAALPLFRSQGSGHIINLSSVAGRRARAGSAVYNATKWGVEAFTEALRQEVSQDRIRVTSIQPGAVETELRQHITHPQTRAENLALSQTMTLLEPNDIAAAVVYAVTQPPRVNVNEILIRPTDQER